jgi:hypothetical protein
MYLKMVRCEKNHAAFLRHTYYRLTAGVVLLDKLVDSGSEFLDSEVASVFCGSNPP